MNTFKLFDRLKEFVDTALKRSKNQEEPPMDNDKKVRWFEKQRVWWSAFVLVLVALLTCSLFLKVDIDVDAEVKIKLERPWDNPKKLGNK